MSKVLTISLALLLVMAFGAMSFAQNNNIQGYGNYTGLTRLGIKAGGIFSKEVGSDAKFSVQGSNNNTNLDFKGGFVGGAFAAYNITEMLAVQPEILFTMKGARRNTSIAVPDEGSASNFRALLNYLEVPVLLKVMPTTKNNVHPEVYAGPAVAFLLSAKSRYDFGGSTISNNIKSDLHKADFGVAFGAGVGYAMGSGNLSLDARYTLGVTKIYNTTPQPNIRNSSISLMAGYSFR